MFFLIGGITPRIKKLEETPAVCPRCGLNTFYRVRIDHYLHLFFIPICPVKKSHPGQLCENCGLEIPATSPGSWTPAGEDSTGNKKPLCPGCGRQLEFGYRFCPYCGRALR
ncbi:MAG: zinc ribbon domain-containing protein [Candidatus Saccharicenans sp.]|uniref:zinc ribbon domain-containing protein n=1 Tax=Candidatus Saccharicenans sp. TaxID=2819258 RepID=UPI004049D071